MERVDEYEEDERYFMQCSPQECHGTGACEFEQQEGAGGDGCHVDEYENMVKELEPDGRIPYQCNILDRLYDPYEQDPTCDLAESVTASVPEKVCTQP